jgi:hypothetical protein
MTQDPWSRPSLEDLKDVLESIGKPDVTNTISAMTREISRTGIGMLHRGSVSPGEATVRMASETREFEYRVLIEWCHPCENGMFMSGGRFLSGNDE